MERAIGIETEYRMHTAEGQAPRIEGHFAVFDEPSRPLWGDMREIIRPGAFDGALGRYDTRAYWNHERNWPLGRVSAGTLSLAVDEHGLLGLIDAPDTQTHRDRIYTPMDRGDVREASFAFLVAAGGDGIVTEGGERMREITQFEEVRDVSVVTDPAYDAAQVGMRAMLEKGLTPEQIRSSLVQIERDTEERHGNPANLRDLDRLRMIRFAELLSATQ